MVLMIGDEPVELELVVPDGPITVEETLPILQGLANLFVDRGVAVAEAAGRTISCRAGCGACCRQIVPISASEARALARLVDEMAEPRRSAVRERFEAALSTLDAGGLLATIDRVREEAADDAGTLGMDYFHAGIACPFLEDESCSIHPDRPLACRQYLVTSPPGNCKSPAAETIEMVALSGRPSRALAVAERSATGIGWMPLVYAIRFADRTPAPPPTRTAADILRDVMGRL